MLHRLNSSAIRYQIIITFFTTAGLFYLSLSYGDDRFLYFTTKSGAIPLGQFVRIILRQLINACSGGECTWDCQFLINDVLQQQRQLAQSEVKEYKNVFCYFGAPGRVTPSVIRNLKYNPLS